MITDAELAQMKGAPMTHDVRRLIREVEELRTTVEALKRADNYEVEELRAALREIKVEAENLTNYGIIVRIARAALGEKP